MIHKCNKEDTLDNKIIRISAELHERLKEHAQADRRTINGEAETILELYFADAEGGLTSEQVAKKRLLEDQEVKEHIVNEGKELGTLPVTDLIHKEPVGSTEPLEKKIAGGKPLSMGEALKAIEARKQELANDLEFCQDIDTRRQLERDAKSDLDVLWDMYHEAKDGTPGK